MAISSVRPQHMADFAREVGALDEGLLAEATSFVASYNEFSAAPNDLNQAGPVDGGAGPPRLEHLGELVQALPPHLRHLGDLTGRVGAIGADFAAKDAQPGPVAIDDADIDASLRARGYADSPQYQPLDVPTPAAAGLTVSSGWAGDPVNTASGNFVEHETDHEAPDHLRLLRWDRVHNSRFPVAGAFGRGWSSWADARLEVGDHGIRYRGPDGQVVAIARRDDGTWVVPASLAAGLRVEGDRYVLRWLDGQVWTFATDGTLSSVGVGGDPLAQIWFDRGPGGRLLSMVSARGPRIDVRWTGDRIVETAGIDGSVAHYRYADPGDDGTGGDLVAVDSPVLVRRYEVDPLGRITALIDGDAVELARNTYDVAGRVFAQRQPHGRVTRFGYLPGPATIVDDRDGDPAGPRAVMHHDHEGRLIAAVDAHGHRQTIVRDPRGNPVRVVDRSGLVTEREFDGEGRGTRRVGPDGSEWRTTYDDSGRVVAVVGPNGATTRLTYDGSSRWPTRIVDPLGAATEATVVDGNVVRVVDADGVALTFEHDHLGQVVATTDAFGHTQRIERDGAGRIVGVTTPTGRRTTCAFDERGDLVQRVDADGSVWQFTWTAGGRPSSMIEPDGASTSWRYGEHGDVVAQIGPDGAEMAFDHDRYGNLVRLIGPGGAKWELDYDELGQLVRRTDPGGGVELRSYDAEGAVVEVRDGAGASEITAWAPNEDGGGGWIGRSADATGATSVTRLDALGRVIEVVGPDGAGWRREHDGAGRVVAIIDPAGVATRYEYSPAGRPRRRIGAQGAVTEWTYDAAGQLECEIDPTGAVTRLRRDGDGRVTRVVHPTGEIESFVYDPLGRVSEHHRPDGSVERWRRDHRGNITEVTSGSGGVRHARYDATGALVEAVDANGGVTRLVRDDAGVVEAVIDPVGEITRYEHDALGRVVTVTDPLGRRTSVVHDAAGRVVEVHRADGSAIAVRRDRAGRVVERRDADGTTVIERDVTGRPVQVVGPGGFVRLGYDGLGRLVHRDDGRVTLGWRYDLDGRCVAFVHPDGVETGYELDRCGRVVAVSHPRAGRAAYTRDAVGRVVAYRDPVQERFCAWVDGQLARVVAVRDDIRSVTALSRDGEGRVVRATVDGEITSFRYDAAGQLVRAGDRVFTYDAGGRLVTESARRDDGSVEVVESSYDGAGRLLARMGGGTAMTVRHDALGRRVESVTAEVSSGRVIAERHHRWDASDRLIGVRDEVGGCERSLTYDAVGVLTAIDDQSLVYDVARAIPQLRQLGGQIVVGAHEPLASIGVDGTTSWFETDWQGSVLGEARDPWGAPSGPSGPSGSAGWSGSADAWSTPSLGYRGELELGVGSLMALGHRVYDAGTRQFLSPDPIGPDLGGPTASTPYHYGDNDPVNLVDPLGLHPLGQQEYRDFREQERTACFAGTSLVVLGAVTTLVPGVGPIAGGALMGMGLNMYAQNQWPPDAKELAVAGVVGGAAGGAGLVGGKVGSSLGTMAFGKASTIAQPAMTGLVAGFGASTANETGNALAGKGFHPMNIVIGTATGGVLGATPGTATKLRDALLGERLPPPPGLVPLGFNSANDFATFGDDLHAGLRDAGYPDAIPIFKGSSVTGVKYTTGEPFDVGRVSDFDIALADPQLLDDAANAGVGLRSRGTRTGPLKDPYPEILGLAPMQQRASEQAGRPVSFMIYGSADAAASREPSIMVPRR